MKETLNVKKEARDLVGKYDFLKWPAIPNEQGFYEVEE